MTVPEVAVERHKTAIVRKSMSLPFQLLTRYGFISERFSILDYGCGRGQDFEELKAKGLNIEAWDPVFRTHGQLVESDIVNLGYVINVIEDPKERSEVLKRAFNYTRKLLAVSVMITDKTQMSDSWNAYSDGVLTTRRTFQKYFTQTEFKEYISKTLGVEAIAVSPGTVFVFKSEQEREQFFESYRELSRIRFDAAYQTSARAYSSLDSVYNGNLGLFNELWDATIERGRFLLVEELKALESLTHVLGSARKVYQLMQWMRGRLDLKEVQEQRRADLLVFFASTHFNPKFSERQLGKTLAADAKTLFGSVKSARETARQALFNIGNPNNITKTANDDWIRTKIGKFEPAQAWTLPTSHLSILSPLLRIYVEAATKIYGTPESADMIKIHFNSGKVTLLKYDDFENNFLPKLLTRVKIDMRRQDFDLFDYQGKQEIQYLYLKSLYMTDDETNFDKQKDFDKFLQSLPEFDFTEYGPSPEFIRTKLEQINSPYLNFLDQ